MKKRSLKKALIWFLSASVSLGNIPVAYGAEFSSGEEIIVDEMQIPVEEFAVEDTVIEDTVPEVITEAVPEEIPEAEEAVSVPEEFESVQTEETGDLTDAADLFSDSVDETDIFTSEPTEEESETPEIKRYVFVNPLYADIVPADKTPDFSEFDEAIEEYDSLSATIFGEGAAYLSEAMTVCDTIEEAGQVIRNKMKNRVETFEYYYETAEGVTTEEIWDMVDAAMVHTGVPTEGDYLSFQYDQFSLQTMTYDEGLIFTWDFDYYTSAEQEAAMDQAVANLLAGMNLSGKTTYEKVRAIYDYICANVVYDYTNLNDETYLLKYTGYAALINKTSVCQGYSVLLYRLLLENGIDCRIIAGDSYGEAHSWNIVKLDGKYYNLDSTWDAGMNTYSYFLKCNDNFEGHTRSTDYTTAAFTAQYVMDTKDYGCKNSEPHKYAANVVAPTCEKDGYTEYTCAGCGDSYRTDEKAALGHSYGTPVVKTAATCTAAGEQVSTCPACGGTKSETIPAAGHKWNEKATVDKAATCTEAGSQSIHCSVCSSVKEGTTETIPAAGHKWDTGVVTKEATDSEDGETTYTCTACKETKKETIPALGHKWNEKATVDKAATCTEAGSKSIHCADCGAVKPGTQETIPATGHSWGDWFVTKESTYTETGIQERVCAVCDENETAEIERKALTPPTLVSAEATAYNKIKFTWKPVSGADGYRVYRKTSDSNWVEIDDVASSATSYTDRTVTAGIKYIYTVKAFTLIDGKIVLGKCYINGKSAVTRPEAPKLVKAEAVDYNKIKMSWQTVDNTLGYRIYRKTPESNWVYIKEIADPKATSFTDTGVKAGVKYSYTVKSYVKYNGKKLLGYCYSAGKSAVTRPEAPKLVSAEGTAYNKIKVKWKTVDNTLGYRIYRKTSGGNWVYIKEIADPKETEYTDTGVSSGVKYTYTVKSYVKYNGKKLLGYCYSAGKSAVTRPEAPKLISAQTVSGRGIKVTWQAISGAAGYRVYRKTAGTDWVYIKDVASNSTSYIDGTAKAGVKYFYTVKSYVKYNGKKLLGYCYINGVSATLPLSAQANYANLVTYLKQNGYVTDDSHYLGYAQYDENDNLLSWIVSYEEKENLIEYSFSIETDEDDAVLIMNVNTYNPTSLNPEFYYVYESLGVACVLRASINGTTYTGQDVSFTVVESQGLTNSDLTELKKTANEALKLAFAGWEVYVLNEIDMSLNGLGFSAYKYE